MRRNTGWSRNCSIYLTVFVKKRECCRPNCRTWKDLYNVMMQIKKKSKNISIRIYSNWSCIVQMKYRHPHLRIDSNLRLPALKASNTDTVMPPGSGVTGIKLTVPAYCVPYRIATHCQAYKKWTLSLKLKLREISFQALIPGKWTKYISRLCSFP